MKNYKPATQAAQAQPPSAPTSAAKPQAKKRFAIPFGDVGTISPRLKKALLIRAIAGAMRK
jgi:hypothetical protein